MTAEILGRNWYKEVGSNGDERAAIRAKFYEKRAEFKGAVNEDITGLRLERTAVTPESKYLFGVLESAFGMKKAYKILKIAAAKEQGFNVDHFDKGDTASIEKQGAATYLVKRNAGGDEREKALLFELEENDTTLEESTEPASNDPVVNQTVELAPGNSPELDEDDLIFERRIQQVLGVSRRVLRGTAITVEIDGDPSLNPTLLLSLDGATRSVHIRHNEGVGKKGAFQSGSYLALFNNKEFKHFGEAVLQASLELKPDEKSHTHFEADPTLPLDGQWKQWEAEIQKTCDAAEISLEISGGEGRKTLKLRRGNKRATIRVVRNLSSRKKGTWTREHCRISYRGDSHYPNPLDAVHHAIQQSFGDASRQITPPWEQAPHEGGMDHVD